MYICIHIPAVDCFRDAMTREYNTTERNAKPKHKYTQKSERWEFMRCRKQCTNCWGAAAAARVHVVWLLCAKQHYIKLHPIYTNAFSPHVLCFAFIVYNARGRKCDVCVCVSVLPVLTLWNTVKVICCYVKLVLSDNLFRAYIERFFWLF